MPEDTYLLPTYSTNDVVPAQATNGENVELPLEVSNNSQSDCKTRVSHVHTIVEILRSTDYALDIFTMQEIGEIKLIDKGGKPYLRDFVSAKERSANPE